MSSGERVPQMLPRSAALSMPTPPPEFCCRRRWSHRHEDVQEFWIADDPESGGVIGCGALHVMWEDLAEVRTLATDPR
jgi:N-acetylglutamate synthase-like GNAT family acetyltransferase